MYRRAIVVLISILTCCAFMCVGFSAWSISAEPQTGADTSGVISSEPVIYSNDYVWIDEENIKMENFTVTKVGFSGGGYNGSFSVPFKINYDKCTGLFEGKNLATGKKELHVQVILSFVDNNSTAENVFNKFSFTCTDAGVTVGSHFIHSSSSFTADLTLDIDVMNSSNNTFTGTFMYTGQNDKDSYDELYNKLTGGKEAINNPFEIVVAVSNGN